MKKLLLSLLLIKLSSSIFPAQQASPGIGLSQAIARLDLEGVHKALEDGADPNGIVPNGVPFQPLQIAINCYFYRLRSPQIEDNTEYTKQIIKMLVARGARCDDLQLSGDIPIALPMLEFLVAEGVLNPDNQKSSIRSIMLCIQHGNATALAFFLNHPGFKALIATSKVSFIRSAVYWHSQQCLRLLLTHHAIDTKQQDQDGNTILHVVFKKMPSRESRFYQLACDRALEVMQIIVTAMEKQAEAEQALESLVEGQEKN